MLGLAFLYTLVVSLEEDLYAECALADSECEDDDDYEFIGPVDISLAF